MAIPADLTPITVTGRYTNPDGKPASGTVEFRLSAPAAVPIDKAIVPQTATEARLDLTGAFSIVLPASDDPDWGVSGLLYRVTERIVGASQRDPYYVNIPAAAAGGTVDLSVLAPAVSGPALVSYVLAAAAGVPGGVATLDGAGQVPLSQLGNAPAGGGGGTPSGTVVSETGFGQAAAAGAATAYSRGDHTHGTPANPVPAHAAAFDPHGDRAYTDSAVVGLVPNARTIATSAPLTGGGALSANRTLGVAVGTSAGTVAAGDHTHPGGGTGIRSVSTGQITTGDITVAAGAFVQIGPDLSIAAVVGDRLVLAPDMLVNATGGDIQFEAATRVSSADNRYWSSGTNTSRWTGGLGSWYVPTGFHGPRSARYTVQADDIVGGLVTVRFYARMPSASRVVFANTGYPLRWDLDNIGQA